ncbi:hypothetical protein BDV59DRAFT_198366 [Aspergillus ambiguus]|uniref:uncharacterized protein n=1 Tax=Aspergillus ambiguus TaxID=176160 RepID=UPI003CCE524B
MKVFAVFGAVAALGIAPAVAQGVNDRVTMIPAPAPPAGTEPPSFPPGPPFASWPTGAPVPTGTAPSGPVPTGTGIPFPPGFERSHARQFRPIDA